MTYCDGVHASQSSNGGGTSQAQHGGHDNVCRKTEEEEDEMGNCTPSFSDDLEESMCVGCIQLELGSKLGKEKHLDSGATAIPPGSAVPRLKIDQKVLMS